MSMDSNDPLQPQQDAGPPLDKPLYGASLPQAVHRYLGKYAEFKGYASRSEYWWMQLVLTMVGGLIWLPYLDTWDATYGRFDPTQGTGTVDGLVLASSIGLFVFGAVTFIPTLAMSWRRLHDAGFAGPMYFLSFIPFVGGFIVLILMLLPTRIDKRNPAWERGNTWPDEREPRSAD